MQEYKIDIVLPDGNIEKANVEENTKIEELAKKYIHFLKIRLYCLYIMEN